MMSSDNDSNSSPMSYSDMYNDDAYVMTDEDEDHTSNVGEKVNTNNNIKSSGPDVDYGFDDEDALDFGGTRAAYNIPYMLQDQASVATTSTTGQPPRLSSASSVSSMPSSVDQGRRPSSLLGGGDDNSVISATPSVDSYGYSAVGSVAGSIGDGAAIHLPPTQILGGIGGGTGSSIPTPYHNTTPSVTGSMSTNPYYESTGEDDESVEMSLVTPEPSTPGRKNPFGKSNSTLQDSVNIEYIKAPPPPVVKKTARQSSTTSYPDCPDDEFGVSVVSSLPDDFSAQSSVKVAYVPSPFDEAAAGNNNNNNKEPPRGAMVPTSPLTPVFPDYQQQKTLPANAPMAPLPHGQMMDPSIPRPDDSDSESGVQVKHHSEYPSQPFGGGRNNGTAVYAYSTTSSSSEASESGRSSDQQYHDEFLEKNQRKAGAMSVSSSVVTEKPKKQTQQQRANPFTTNANEDPEAALDLKDQDGKNGKKEKKKMSCCRKCLCIFIPALLLLLGGGGYYAYTKDFYGFDFFGLYESKDAPNSGSQGTNPENPQDKPASDPQENDGGISFPSSTPPTAAPVATEPPKGVINDDNAINGNSTNDDLGDLGDIGGNSTNTNSTAGDDPTKQPHLTPVDTKPPTQSPSIMTTATVMPSTTPVPAPTPTTTEATLTPTSNAESEIIIQYRSTIQSYLVSQGISFNTEESSTTVNALDRLMNDIVAAMFQEEEAANNDPFYEEFYRVTQRFALYCLGVALEETAAEDYATVLEVAQPWTPRSEPTPMYQLVFERLNAGETKSLDHCNWPGVACSSGDQPEIVSITWNQQGLDGTIPSEISLLQSLTSIDLSNNYIHGTIPSQVYELPNLERLVLHHNYLEGQLNLQSASNQLIHLDLGHNLHSGNLQSLESMQGLQYLNLNQNTLTGSIPETLQLPNIEYFDVGHNLLSGPLPTALPKSATQARHFHLEHNGFSGNLPVEYLWAGNWGLLTLKVQNNQLTGAVPAGGSQTMVQFTLQGNSFSEPLSQKTCDLDRTLGLGGSVLEFEADCSICQCTGGVFCSSCNDGQNA